jgi:hypothetical protein
MSNLSLPFFSRKSSNQNHDYGTLPAASDQHVEHHFESPEIIRDIVLGLSDGLTVSNFNDCEQFLENFIDEFYIFFIRCHLLWQLDCLHWEILVLLSLEVSQV